jgi:hypothetical protein
MGPCALLRLPADVSLVELDGLHEGARAEEPMAHALVRLAPDRLRPRRVLEQTAAP